MKYCREICFAKDAGMVSYPGLPGQIKTGCTASPAYKSRYCKNHQTRVCQTAIHQGVQTCIEKNTCVETLVLKRILEYSLQNQKNIQILKVTICLSHSNT